jgi:hypothetical protein
VVAIATRNTASVARELAAIYGRDKGRVTIRTLKVHQE